jgi:hypothetical protein
VKRDFVRHIEERANKKVGELTMEKIDDIMKDVFCGTAVETITTFMDKNLVANPKLLENAKKFVVTRQEIRDINITNNPVGGQGGGSRKRTFRHNRRTQKRRPSMKGGALEDEIQLETQLLQLLQRKLGHSSDPILSSSNPVLKQNDADTTPKLTNLVTLLKGYGADSLEAVDKMAIKFQESMTTPRNMEMLKAIFECVLKNKFKRVLKEKLTVKLQEQVFYGHDQQTLNGIITDAINDNRITIIKKVFNDNNKSLKELKKKQYHNHTNTA